MKNASLNSVTPDRVILIAFQNRMEKNSHKITQNLIY